MTWLTDLSWWQIVFIIILVVWVSKFLFELEECWSTAQHAAGYNNFLALGFMFFFFLAVPYTLWSDWKNPQPTTPWKNEVSDINGKEL